MLPEHWNRPRDRKPDRGQRVVFIFRRLNGSLGVALGKFGDPEWRAAGGFFIANDSVLLWTPGPTVLEARDAH